VCGSKGTSTTSSTFTPPADVTANYDYLANQAKSVAATPFQQYQGEMVAGLTPTQEAGIQNVNAAAGLAQPYYQAGTDYVQQGATPFGQQALNQYMSPYIGDVVSQTMANLGETNAQQRQQLLGNQVSQGAFGGDRGQIAQAELARQQNLATGQTLANVLQGGYGQALGQFNADQTRALQAGSTLGQLGTGAQSAGLQGAQAQLGAGAQQQAVQQAQDVANQQQFQAAQAYPFQTTQYLGNLLLGIGGQSGGTSLTNAPGPNVGSQILGGLTTLASIPWGSDERLKENMEPVGETYDGQKIYKFNYKNDGHTMLGLSAQEVEKHHPDAVHKDGEGMRMVDYEKAVNHAAQRGHFAHGGIPDWMGGAVGADGLGRAHYATDGAIPYSDQPSGGSTKPLTLADVMRVSQGLLADKPGGKTNIPKAPSPSEEGGLMDVAKQLANATPEQRANMRANAGKLGLGTANVQDVLGTPGQRVGDVGGLYSAPIGPLQQFASGGVVGRHKYATDGSVQESAQGTQTTDQPQSLFERVSGQPLSDNARMGLLAAGLGMLSSRSPFFGVGVGEGATAGLGTYYNALANQRAYEKQQRELELTEEQRNIERQRVGIEAAKSPAEIAKLNAETAAAKAGLYSKIWVEGDGFYLTDNTNPYKPPIKITDDQMRPLGNIDPATVPNAPGSATPGSTVVTPKLGEPAPAPKAGQPNPPAQPKPEEIASSTEQWTPVTTVPTDYHYAGQFNLKNTPGAMEKAVSAGDKLMEEQTHKAQGAFDTLYTLDNMDRSFNDVSKTGILSPGQHIDERTTFAEGVNTMSRILGGSYIYDPKDVAALEELAKDNKRLGFALSKTMGKEPGFIVQQAIGANPSAANSPLGFHRLTEALRQASMYEQDRQAFYNAYQAKFGHLNGADALFTQLNPPQKYADRAVVNTIDPSHLQAIRAWAQSNQGKDLGEGRKEFDATWGKGAFKLATGM